MSQRLSARRAGRAMLTVTLVAAATLGGVDLGAGAVSVSPVTPVHAVVVRPAGAGRAR
jgi:hypothetical protein